MIKIWRTGECPAILAGEGEAARAKLCQAVESGEQPRKIKDKIYGDASVRAQLSAEQHGKCCYCETRLDRATIDHFRPIRAVQETKVHRYTPGYYWLAYDWHNLLLACSACNETYKREWFPLADPSARVRHHSEASRVTDERPLLLNPVEDDPELHIVFARQTPIARSARGRRTIELLHLDRAVLEESRGDVIGRIEMLWVILHGARSGEALPERLVVDACRELARRSEPREPYAAAIRYILRSHLGADAVFPITAEILLAWANVHEQRGALGAEAESL